MIGMKSKGSGSKGTRGPDGAQPSEEEQAKANGFLVVGISPSSCLPDTLTQRTFRPRYVRAPMPMSVEGIFRR